MRVKMQMKVNAVDMGAPRYFKKALHCLLLPAVLVLVAGCSVGPRYQPPELTLPAEWRADVSAAPFEKAAWPSADWWTRFGNPELNRLIETALFDNYELKAALDRIAQVRAQARIAGADLYPALDAGGSVLHRRDFSEFGGTTTSYRIPLNVGYELDLWGKNRSASEAAGMRVQGSLFDRQAVALSLVSEVAVTCFEVFALDDRLAITHDVLNNANEVLEILEKRFREGAVSALEVSQQRNAVATIRSSLPALEQAREQAANALAILLGRAPEAFQMTRASLDQVRTPTIPAGLPSALLDRRPDIRRIEADLIAANADVRVAKAILFPSIQLTAEGGITSLALSSLFNSGSAFYNLAANIVAPIFQGGRLRGQYDLARARYDELVNAYRQTVITAFRDVEDALIAVEKLTEREAAQREAEASAESTWELADLRFREGAVDFLTVLDAQRTLLNARDALVQTRLARLNAAVGVYRALGGGWEGNPAEQPSA